MLEIKNWKVYDLKESVIACRNSMRVEMPEYTDNEFTDALKRAQKLVAFGGGSGHTNFRKGIRVSFDIIYPNYISPEMQRYGFFDIICSSSKIHKLASMDVNKCFNKYVDDGIKFYIKTLIEQYNKSGKYYDFMRLLSNCPQGIELFMRVSTNYEQLATIYKQRRNHKLKEDWGAFCDWIEQLPYAKELILPTKNK